MRPTLKSVPYSHPIDETCVYVSQHAYSETLMNQMPVRCASAYDHLERGSRCPCSPKSFSPDYHFYLCCKVICVGTISCIITIVHLYAITISFCPFFEFIAYNSKVKHYIRKDTCFFEVQGGGEDLKFFNKMVASSL